MWLPAHLISSHPQSSPGSPGGLDPQEEGLCPGSQHRAGAETSLSGSPLHAFPAERGPSDFKKAGVVQKVTSHRETQHKTDKVIFQLKCGH